MTTGVRGCGALGSATAVLVNVNHSLVNVYLGRNFIDFCSRYSISYQQMSRCKIHAFKYSTK
jgi:hypothetical protein